MRRRSPHFATTSKAATITQEILTTTLSNGSFVGGKKSYKDMAVVSGYASNFTVQLIGDTDSDSANAAYLVEMIVGPEWRGIYGVSPIVTRSGFSHSDPDEDDWDGYAITSCEWAVIDTDDGQFIQLTARVNVAGSDSHRITGLAFQLTAIGTLMK